jgi:hypothetical protein
MQDPFVGNWALNREQSQFDANHQPRAAAITIELIEGGYLMKAEGINQKGEKVAERPQRLVPDGQPHAVPDFAGLTAVTTRPDANTLHSEVRREDGSLVGGGSFAVSADGSTLTSANFGYDTQLRQFKQSTVWYRQT